MATKYWPFLVPKTKCTDFTGFHRPLRVVPPTASPQPPSYTARTPYFPSHFFPEKLHQYWQYYYPRIPGTSFWFPKIPNNSISKTRLSLQKCIEEHLENTIFIHLYMIRIEPNLPILMSIFTRLQVIQLDLFTRKNIVKYKNQIHFDISNTFHSVYSFLRGPGKNMFTVFWYVK